MNNDPFQCHSQPTHTGTPQCSQQSQQPLALPPPQLARPALRDIPQHIQRSHASVQAPPAPAYNPQLLYTNYDYGRRWQRPQLQYAPHQYHALPPVAQPPPHTRHPVVQPSYNPYQSTAYQYYTPHVVASPQPQLPYYPHLQSQYHITLQHLMPTDRQQLDDPNLNGQVQHREPPSPHLQFKPPQDTVYPSQNQESGEPNNALLGANEEDAVGRRGGISSGGSGARGGSLSGTRGGMAGRGWNGSHMDSNGGDDGGGPFVHAHGPGGNFGGAASMQAGGRNQFPIIAESATVHVATQFQDAHGFNIWGNTQFRNSGVDHSVNFYGGTHGLEKLENFVSFAALHDSSEQDSDRRCHPGTRENVLSRMRYWIDNPNATDRIFWLYGPAGAGKSAIAQTISHGYHQGEVAATFFFFRSDTGRNDGNRLFPTIAWQLAFSIPATKNFIVYELDRTPHLPTKAVETQFEHLVARLFQPTNNIASQMPHPAPVVIIDGVDECSDEQLQRRFLTIIGNAVKDCRVPLRFLISSRPEALIEETLDQFQEFTLRIDLATLNGSNHDIEKYLVDKFSIIAKKQGLAPTWPGQKTIEDIVFKSSGNFILSSTLIRFIGDEDYSAESQLDIVRKLKPHGSMSPFTLLDELYLEILKQQRDQDFLKTFLALLVARSSIKLDDIYRRPHLHEDDTTLMNVSAKELHIKLRRMRSLLKFKPFIDVYHKSFLDFLQDASRSGQYHVSEKDGLKRYLELIVNSVVRHVSMATEESNFHDTCRSSPEFKDIVRLYPPKIVMPVEDWQEALKPLLDLQDKLLKTSKPRPCHVTQVMRDLQLHLVILQRGSHDIAAVPAPESNNNNNNKTVTELSHALATEAMQNIPEKDLDRCLSGLLSCLQNTNSVLAVDTVIIERMTSLLAFDPAETAARVLSATDAQKLVDIVDSLANNESFLSQCGRESRDAARKACTLVSEIFARVPVLPQSLFLNGPTQQCDWFVEYSLAKLEYLCSSALISRFLDRSYTLPIWFIYQEDKLKIFDGNTNEFVDKWLERARPNFVTRIRVMLEAARIVRYLRSKDVVTTLDSFGIQSDCFVLDSDLRVKIVLSGAFAWQVWENLIFNSDGSMTNFTYKSNVSAFADLFHEVCFNGNNENRPKHLDEDVRQLIKQCRAKNPKSRPTMEDVVKEMETWNLT